MRYCEQRQLTPENYMNLVYDWIFKLAILGNKILVISSELLGHIDALISESDIAITFSILSALFWRYRLLLSLFSTNVIKVCYVFLTRKRFWHASNIIDAKLKRIDKTIYIFETIYIEYDSIPGGRLNKKDGLTRYGDSHVKDKTS